MSYDVTNAVQVDIFHPHPNADKLRIVKLGTMQVCYGGDPKPGDYVHVLPEAFATKATLEKLGVWQYTDHKVRDGAAWGRVRAARLRGQISYGFLVPLDDWLAAGLHPANFEYYDPDIHTSVDNRHRAFIQIAQDPAFEREHPLFHKYGSIKNYHSDPYLIQDGETVVVTEKIHGTNVRIGLVRTGFMTYEVMLGSHNKRRAVCCDSLYELPLRKYPQLVKLMRDCSGDSVVVYGEVFGAGVQDLAYGRAKGDEDFRMFDVRVDDSYLGDLSLTALSIKHKVPLVPKFYEGPYSPDLMWTYAAGSTTVGGGHIREGVVVTTQDHRQLKFINEDYLTRKDGSESH